MDRRFIRNSAKRETYARPALFQLGHTLPRGDRGRQCRAACVRAILGREDGKRAVADQLDHVTTMRVDR
jgi:hypothetical protein